MTSPSAQLGRQLYDFVDTHPAQLRRRHCRGRTGPTHPLISPFYADLPHLPRAYLIASALDPLFNDSLLAVLR